MIGTEKQIAYANAILKGARAYNAMRVQDPRHRQYAEGRIAAIDFIVAIAQGRQEDASRIMETADIPLWVFGTYVIAKSHSERGWQRDEPSSLDEAVVVAGNVIDALKGDYYSAKDNGLI